MTDPFIDVFANVEFSFLLFKGYLVTVGVVVLVTREILFVLRLVLKVILFADLFYSFFITGKCSA